MIYRYRLLFILLVSLFFAINANPVFAVHTDKSPRKVHNPKAEKQAAKWEKKLKKLSAKESGFLTSKKPRPWLALGLGILGGFTILLAIYAAFGSAALATALVLIAALVIGLLGLFFGLDSLKRRKETKSPILTSVISILGTTLSGAIVVAILFALINAIFNS